MEVIKRNTMVHLHTIAKEEFPVFEQKGHFEENECFIY